MENIFSKSEGFKEEYSCRVVQIGKVRPIEKSKYLGVTLIGDATVVVRKDEIHEGDVYLYVGRECVLPGSFLHRNNLYMFDKYQLNSNAEEVRKAIEEAEKHEGDERDELMLQAKRMVGIFGTSNRVKSAKLQGVYSHGFIFTPKEFIAWKPELADFFDEHPIKEFVGESFDTVGDSLFCYAYVPPVNRRKRDRVKKPRKTRIERRVEKYFGWLPKNAQKSIVRMFQKPKRKLTKKEKRMEGVTYLIADEFDWHYDTGQLGPNIFRLNRNSVVTLSVKVHGTSAIYANTLREFPYEDIPEKVLKRNKIYRKLHLPKSWMTPETYRAYDYVYSTRNKIQNKDMNSTASVYDNMDVYKPYYEIFKNLDCLEPGMIVYGEIFGYANGSSKGIQGRKDAVFDYGCKVGTNKFMPYRISTRTEKGWKEWSIPEVVEWTDELISKHPELEDVIQPLLVVYHGTLGDLYPDIEDDEYWHENVILRLKTEKKFHMEEDEPLCKTKLPREGLCCRIMGDMEPKFSCFKLKCDKFFNYEEKANKAGVVDVEMMSEYGDDDAKEGMDGVEEG